MNFKKSKLNLPWVMAFVFTSPTILVTTYWWVFNPYWPGQLQLQSINCKSTLPQISLIYISTSIGAQRFYFKIISIFSQSIWLNWFPTFQNSCFLYRKGYKVCIHSTWKQRQKFVKNCFALETQVRYTYFTIRLWGFLNRVCYD